MGISTRYKAFLLGADLSSKLRLSLYTWSFLKKRLKNPNAGFRLRKFGRECSISFSGWADIDLFKDIFIKGEYDCPLPEEPRVIFDLGSNIGFSAIYFRLKYPRARIYAFEPDPDNFLKLKKNTAQFENLFVFSHALSGENGRRRFYRNPLSPVCSSFLERQRSGLEQIEVEGKTLDAVMSELAIDRVDLLKFDIEGAEYEVLRNCRQLSRVKTLIGEFHPDLAGVGLEAFLKIFEASDTTFDRNKADRYIVRATRKPSANHEKAAEY